MAKTSKLPRFYFDFKKERENLAKNQTNFTSPVTLIIGLNGSPKMLQAEGLENVFRRHEKLAITTRKAVQTLGRFFERYPAYRGRVVFAQLAAPSRSTIARYKELDAEVDDAVREVNTAYQTKRWQPILYLKRHHDHREIWPFYRHADFCLVTSLHDGMNLVAKEFVSVREDGDGVLILSRFTGASSEMRDALLVNPYDVDATAEAILCAVEMTRDERRARLARMRQVVREHNIYRWAGSPGIGPVGRVWHAGTRQAR